MQRRSGHAKKVAQLTVTTSMEQSEENRLSLQTLLENHQNASPQTSALSLAGTCIYTVPKPTTVTALHLQEPELPGKEK